MRLPAILISRASWFDVLAGAAAIVLLAEMPVVGPAMAAETAAKVSNGIATGPVYGRAGPTPKTTEPNKPWVAAGDRAVHQTGPASFDVPPLVAPANSLATVPAREWINADGSARAVQLSGGVPVVAPATATITARQFAPNEGVTIDGRTVVAPPLVSRSGGVTPSGSSNPTTVTFGNVPINTTVTQSVTITVDAGYRTEVASGSGLNTPFSFDFDTCGTGGGFAGPGTCTVKESFTPTTLAASSGTTNVFECPIAGGTCINIPFNENGTGVSVASANPTTIPFGNVPINTTVTQSVTITVDAGYRSEVASGSGLNQPFSFNFDTCGTGGGFAGPGTCNVKESFTPTTLAFSSGTTNVFECPIAGGTCIAIPFNENGTGVSVASASPSNIPYGNVPLNTTATQSVTITVDAGYRSEVASGSGLNQPFSFNFDTCGAGGGFAGPGTCNVKESFTPTTLAFSSGTTNVFECPIAGGTCIAIPFNESGTGISVASASPANIPFGNVPVNTTVTQTVTITVDTGYRTEVASGSGLNVPFSFDFDVCGAGGGFAGPGTCTVKESYHPTAFVFSSATTNVFECPISGGSCIGVPFNLQGTGVAAPPALVNAVSRKVHGAAGVMDLPLAP
jgi:hypothetical protein